MNNDPREKLRQELIQIGVEVDDAAIIALDAGIGLVNKDYLYDMRLRNKKLTNALSIVRDFYTEQKIV